MHTGVITEALLWDTRLDDNIRFKEFENNLKTVIDGDESDYTLSEYDVVMFPILENEHYYLVCFDLHYPAIEVIDNVHERRSFVRIEDVACYHKKSTVNKVKHIFVEYLRRVGNVKYVPMSRCIPVKKKLSWATINNPIDCGVFVTHHMETYMGSKVKRWTCGFLKEGPRQDGQLRKLRVKYAYRILLSEANKHKDKKMLESMC